MSLDKETQYRKDSKMKIKTILGFLASSFILAGCHTLTHSVHTANSTKPLTESAALTINETHPLKGSEKVSVHAYSYMDILAWISM